MTSCRHLRESAATALLVESAFNKCPPHLRHTTATLLLTAGVTPFAVQRIFRHSDPKLTTEIYGHCPRIPPGRDSGCNRFQARLLPGCYQRAPLQHTGQKSRSKKILLPAR